MPNNPSTHEEKIRSFWDRYVKKLNDSGVKAPFDRWMVIRAEQYLAAHPGRRLVEQTPAEVNAYLAEQGRDAALKPWQFRQTVDAIQTLFELAGGAVLGQVDWEHWRGSARGLSADHPTVARDYQPVPGAARPGVDTSPISGEGDAANGVSFAAIRQVHGALLDQVAKAIRVRGLAIRTEQTYLHWIMRFIGFLGNRDPSAQGPAEGAAFLEQWDAADGVRILNRARCGMRCLWIGSILAASTTVSADAV